MSPLTYEETVVVITDGSTPSAQLYARLFKARGAKVVLNIPPSSKSHFSNNLQEVCRIVSFYTSGAHKKLRALI